MKTSLGRALLAMSTLAAIAVGTAGAPAAQAQENPYERGPDPTRSLIESPRGPFSTSEVGVSRLVSGFGGGRIYYPTSTSEGTFGAVAISPGYTASWSSLSWLGPRLASHGFVVIGINTNSRYDFPESRGRQLLAALDYVRGSSSVRNRVDGSRLAVAGHSMGGGGSLEAAEDRPSLEAAVPIAPWNSQKSWSRVSTPGMIITGERDSIAPPSSHGSLFYGSLGADEKAYMELDNASHFFPQSPNTTMAKYMISWLKRFVDNDTRYERFLCPAPGDRAISEYRETCPHTS